MTRTCGRAGVPRGRGCPAPFRGLRSRGRSPYRNRCVGGAYARAVGLRHVCCARWQSHVRCPRLGLRRHRSRPGEPRRVEAGVRCRTPPAARSAVCAPSRSDGRTRRLSRPRTTGASDARGCARSRARHDGPHPAWASWPTAEVARRNGRVRLHSCVGSWDRSARLPPCAGPRRRHARPHSCVGPRNRCGVAGRVRRNVGVRGRPRRGGASAGTPCPPRPPRRARPARGSRPTAGAGSGNAAAGPQGTRAAGADRRRRSAPVRGGVRAGGNEDSYLNVRERAAVCHRVISSCGQPPHEKARPRSNRGRASESQGLRRPEARPGAWRSHSCGSRPGSCE